MRTAADLTQSERDQEFEQAIILVESAVENLLTSPRKYADIALHTAIANWNVSTESMAFLEGRSIEDISTVDPRLAEAHRKMASFAEECGLDLDAFKRPTFAYLRKLDRVQTLQATLALLPLLNDKTQDKASSVVHEMEYWLAIAAKNGEDMGEWLMLVQNVASILKPEFHDQAAQLEALMARCTGHALAVRGKKELALRRSDHGEP